MVTDLLLIKKSDFLFLLVQDPSRKAHRIISIYPCEPCDEEETENHI